MTNEISAADHQPPVGAPGPTFVAPGQSPAGPPPPAGPTPYSPPPAAYGAQPAPVPPVPMGPAGPNGPMGPNGPVGPNGRTGPDGPTGPQDLRWEQGGLVATPALPPERVGRGAAFALLAVPVGAVLAVLIWKIGFIASITSFLMAALAAILYLRGSGGRVKKGLFVVVAVIALGIVVSFFSVVAADLWAAYPQLDPDIAATYPSRWSFVHENLFYGPVLKFHTKEAVMFPLFGIIGGFSTITRLVRARAMSGPGA